MIEIPERLVFLDVETTGLDGKSDRVIEIFLLAVDKSGKVHQYESLINPKRPIPQRITEITGITNEDVKNAPTEAVVASQIREFIGLGTPVAHNLPFDRRFLDAMFLRNNLLELGAVGIDTLAISRELFPRLAVYPGGGGSHRLSNLMYHFGLEHGFANAHRAKDDVMLLVEVYRNLQAVSRGELSYPEAITHGCPTCRSAMQLTLNGDERLLTCRKSPGCSVQLVI